MKVPTGNNVYQHCQESGNQHAPTSHWSENYYFGVRAYPYSTDPDVNPLTFGDVVPDTFWVPPTVDSSDADVFSFSPGEVHLSGQVWGSALWQCRALLIDKYGYAGNEIMLTNVVGAMGLMMPNASFLHARDTILAFDYQNAGATIAGEIVTSNECELWKGFAARGMGMGSLNGFQVPPGEWSVVESFRITPGCVDYNESNPVWEDYP